MNVDAKIILSAERLIWPGQIAVSTAKLFFAAAHDSTFPTLPKNSSAQKSPS